MTERGSDRMGSIEWYIFVQRQHRRYFLCKTDDNCSTVCNPIGIMWMWQVAGEPFEKCFDNFVQNEQSNAITSRKIFNDIYLAMNEVFQLLTSNFSMSNWFLTMLLTFWSHMQQYIRSNIVWLVQNVSDIGQQSIYSILCYSILTTS